MRPTASKPNNVDKNIQIGGLNIMQLPMGAEWAVTLPCRVGAVG